MEILDYFSDNCGKVEPYFAIVVIKGAFLKKEMFYMLPSGIGIQKGEKLFLSN